MTENVIKHKIYESRMILKLWIYNDVSNSTYTKEVDINDDFLE